MPSASRPGGAVEAYLSSHLRVSRNVPPPGLYHRIRETEVPLPDRRGGGTRGNQTALRICSA
jgi:hypothetical protein